MKVHGALMWLASIRKEAITKGIAKASRRFTGRARAARRAAIACVSALALMMVTLPHSEAVSSGADVTEPADAVTPRRLRLISSEQYLNTLNYVFGIDLRIDPRFPPLTRTDGLLENGAAVGGVTDSQLEQYQRTASTVAARVVSPERRNFLFPCKPVSETKADRKCAEKFLSESGRYLYRRPMTKVEVKEVVDTASTAADRLKDFYTGLSIALEGMLLDPEVLFITERLEPDPKRPGHQRLDAYSLASRLSFFLWNAGPDDQLLQAAESGDIQTEIGRARVVDMMLASPRLEAGMRAFFDDMLNFDDFNTLAKDPTVYPSFTGVVVTDAREQTLRTVIDQLITKRKDYRDLYTTRQTFISPSLAVLYGLPSPPDWAPYEFPADSSRSGLLTQISFLAVHSHPGRSSPTLRGKAVREILLCQPVPRPPPNVDFSIVDDPKSTLHTARERLEAHRQNPVCAGCHKITDPMGLALEKFDGAGEYRETEKGAPIDASGSLDGKEYKDVLGLAQALHDHPALPACLVKRVYAYSTGGGKSPQEQPMLDYLNGRFAAEGYRVPDLLRTITLSAAFSDVYDAGEQPKKVPPAPMKAASVAAPQNVASVSK